MHAKPRVSDIQFESRLALPHLFPYKKRKLPLANSKSIT